MTQPNFLGTGWGFPVDLAQGQNSIRLTHNEQNIQQSIWIILSTARGERQMRPDFGCGIHDFVFGLNQQDSLGQIAAEVREALIIWEPRIEILGVTALPDQTIPTQLNIEINYQVRSTNSRFNLVYPFYLEL
jgi:phage baseplate assembly protein W